MQLWKLAKEPLPSRQLRAGMNNPGALAGLAESSRTSCLSNCRPTNLVSVVPSEYADELVGTQISILKAGKSA